MLNGANVKPDESCKKMLIKLLIREYLVQYCEVKNSKNEVN